MYVILSNGDKFHNGEMEYTVIKFRTRCLENVALLERNAYCPYVVARDLRQNSDGTYTWAFGHYFNSLSHAEADFDETYNKLL